VLRNVSVFVCACMCVCTGACVDLHGDLGAGVEHCWTHLDRGGMPGLCVRLWVVGTPVLTVCRMHQLSVCATLDNHMEDMQLHAIHVQLSWSWTP